MAEISSNGADSGFDRWGGGLVRCAPHLLGIGGVIHHTCLTGNHIAKTCYELGSCLPRSCVSASPELLQLPTHVRATVNVDGLLRKGAVDPLYLTVQCRQCNTSYACVRSNIIDMLLDVCDSPVADAAPEEIVCTMPHMSCVQTPPASAAAISPTG